MSTEEPQDSNYQDAVLEATEPQNADILPENFSYETQAIDKAQGSEETQANDEAQGSEETQTNDEAQGSEETQPSEPTVEAGADIESTAGNLDGEASSEQEPVETKHLLQPSDLPVTMTGKAFAKLQAIMVEKNMDLDKAMEYFFNLHQKVSTPKPRGKPGRPRKSASETKASRSSSTSSVRQKRKAPDTGAGGDGENTEVDVVGTGSSAGVMELGSDMSSGLRKSRRTIRKPKTEEFAYFDTLKQEDIDSDLDIEYLKDDDEEEDDEEFDEETDPTVTIQAMSQQKKTRAKRRKINKDEFLTPEEQTSLKCSECDRAFEGRSQLIRHKWNFHDTKPRPFVCSICGYGALYNCDLERHMRIHSREKEYKCDICDFTTVWKKNLDIHMQLHDPDRQPWKCEICAEVIYSQQKIKQHKLSHDKTALKCEVCDAAFENQRFLDMHKTIHSADKPFKCELCKFSTGFKANLRNHLYNRHKIGERYTPKKKEFKCDKCSKVFKNEERRLVHQQVHDNNLPESQGREQIFNCPYGCEYRSKDLDHVVKHMIIHSDEKTYKCEQCDYATKWKKDLANHLLRHSGQKNERCDICGYMCYTKSRLKIHMNKHNDKKEHMCEWCGQYFKHKNLLKIHTLYHTGEPRFKCDQCDFATITDTRLKKHKLSHCEDRVHICEICDKTFKQAHHLNQHRDSVHFGKPSYRQRKAFTYSGEMSDNTTIILQTGPDGTGETVLTAEDLGENIGDSQVVVTTEETNTSENCQYVMVHTPSGYQYVALVLPPKEETGEEMKQEPLSETVIEEPSQALHQLSQGGATMEEAQILLPQIDDDQQYVYVTIPEGESVENISAVETLIALQP